MAAALAPVGDTQPFGGCAGGRLKSEDDEAGAPTKPDGRLTDVHVGQLPPPPPAPEIFTVTFATDVKHGSGKIAVDVNRSWAPLGADRFHAAVSAGFYDNSAFFRVVAPNAAGCVLTCGGIVQFGISGNKTLNSKWLGSHIKDDPVTQSNTAGAVNFADAGPNTRSTELVFMLGDNTKQDAKGFAPFGRITSAAGLATARAIYNPTPSDTGGVDQGKYIARGNSWINSTYPGVNFILTAAVTAPGRATAKTDDLGGKLPSALEVTLPFGYIQSSFVTETLKTDDDNVLNEGSAVERPKPFFYTSPLAHRPHGPVPPPFVPPDVDITIFTVRQQPCSVVLRPPTHSAR